MADVIDDVVDAVSELDALKARADMLGIAYHPSIGVDKLREKVNAALSADAPAAVTAEALSAEQIENQARIQRLADATKLVRIRLTCMNPNKTEWPGEIISVGNAEVGTHTKYIPFNAPDGWHVPQIILNQLQQRECQVFVAVRDEKGNTIRKGKLIKEFAIEILEPLTQEELDELARRQAMSGSLD